MPAISVVIPAYNAERTLGETLQRALAQTLRDIEVLVIDDGSTDGTAQIASTTGDPRVRTISVSNGGVARARNRAIQAVSGEIIAFLDADDLWMPTKLERQLELMTARPDVGMCFTSTVRIDAASTPLGLTTARGYEDWSEALLLGSNLVTGSCSSAMVRTVLARQTGGFDPRLSQCADWDFWLRLSQVTRFAAIDELLVLYRVHPGSMSNNVALLERDTFAVLDKFYGRPQSARYEPIRRKVYSNHWMICAGSYLHAAQPGQAIRCLVKGLRACPRNIGRPLGVPIRWSRRIMRRSRRSEHRSPSAPAQV